MNNHEQTSFDELIEAMWAGELDEAGKARLEALAAADPALDAQLRRERAITATLAGRGPNRAPEGLAKAVFARLDLDSQPAAKPKPARVRMIPRALWFTPAFRWSLAAATLLVVFLNVTWLLNRDRMGGDTIATLQPVPLKTPNAVGSPFVAARYNPLRSPETKKQTTPTTTSAQQPETRSAAVTTPKESPIASPTQSATPAAKPTEKVLAKAIAPTPAEKWAPKPPPAQPITAKMPAQTTAPEQALVLHMLIPAENAAGAAQIMRTITEAGGTVKGTQQSTAQVLRVEGSMPPGNMASFVERLAKIGIKRSRTETALPYQFKVVQGESLLRETGPAGAGSAKPRAIPLTLLIEETPLKK